MGSEMCIRDRHRIIIFLSLLLLLVSSIQAQGVTESSFLPAIQQRLGGSTEVRCYGGRADLVNDTYAIEVEFAHKWKNSIGQSLWYGLQLDRQPGIVIIMQSLNDRKYGIQLQSALDYAGLTEHIKVWFWPEDFGGSLEVPATKLNKIDQQTNQASGSHWLTNSSNVRHNSSCSYFQKSRGRFAASHEGKACGRCGG